MNSSNILARQNHRLLQIGAELMRLNWRDRAGLAEEPGSHFVPDKIDRRPV
jgi:hypothetical protein